MRGLLRSVLYVGLGLVITAGLAFAGQGQPRLKKVSAPHVFGVDGHQLYDAYCVSCHGRTAEGNGPAAALLEVPVPDLTVIAVRNGRFDERHVMFHIMRGHEPMPEWQPVLRANYNQCDALAMNAAVNLTRHIQALQMSASR